MRLFFIRRKINIPTYYFDLVDDDSVHTDIYFSFKDAPKIGSIIEHEGCKWRRMPTVPQANSDSGIDPFSQKQFTEKTGKMKGTWGEMNDMSAEMSAKRAQIAGGTDPVLAKHEAKQKALTGLESFRSKKVKAKESLAKKGIVLE